MGQCKWPDGEMNLAFVSRGPVNRGYGNVVQSEVDTQLTAVMNEMAEHERSKRRNTRHREHFLAAALQGPHARVFRIGLVERDARHARHLVESRQQLGTRLQRVAPQRS